jgi:signal transduction histidine kinase
MSLPLLLAAGMVLEPVEAGLLAFLGSADPRELKGEIWLGRAMFNRSQVAISSVAASFAFHGLGGEVNLWPAALGLGIVAVAVDAEVNLLSVTLAIVFATRMPVREVPGRVILGSPQEYVVRHFGFGLISIFFAVAFHYVGPWGLALSLVPIAIAREMFVRSKASAVAASQVRSKSRLIEELGERIAEERKDERARVASVLHDDVLQALYKVHLMGEVLRRDLATGQLLQLEDDLPPLLQATNRAADAMRELIKGLRQSSLGPGGLTPTIRLLIEHLEAEFNVKVRSNVEDVGGSSQTQLLIYQVAREALTNAVKHSGSDIVCLRLFREGPDIRLIVQDGGKGFIPSEANVETHFGLQMMRERAEMTGGSIYVDSGPGRGTSVVARFPASILPE